MKIYRLWFFSEIFGDCRKHEDEYYLYGEHARKELEKKEKEIKSRWMIQVIKVNEEKG